MIYNAILKIKTEMDANKNNSYVQVVGGFLLQYLDQNPEVAEKVIADGKTITKSLDEMRKVAEKKNVGNWAVLTDQEGFEVVLQYFGIDKAILSAPVIPPAPKPAAEAFDIKLADLLRGDVK